LVDTKNILVDAKNILVDAKNILVGAKNILVDIKKNLSEHFDLKNHKPWFHNNIIGWIRFYMLGSQLRGEIFYTCNERVGNHLNKKIESSNYCPILIEFSFDDVSSSEKILNQIKLKIIEVQNDKSLFPIKKFYIDLSEFNRISEFIDWKSLLEEYSRRFYDHNL